MFCKGTESKITECNPSTWGLSHAPPCANDDAVLLMCKNLSEVERAMIAKREKFSKTGTLKTEIDKTMRFFKSEMYLTPNGENLQFYLDKLERANSQVQELMNLDTSGATNYGIYEQFFNIIVRNWINETIKPLTAAPCVDKNWKTCSIMKRLGRCNVRVFPTIVENCRKTCNACKMPTQSLRVGPSKPTPITAEVTTQGLQ